MTSAGQPSDPFEPDHEQLAAIVRIVSRAAGMPLIDTYKPSCLQRRIAARVRRSGCRDAAQYLHLLADDPAEPPRLCAALMVHVSQFFRNPSLFMVLQQQVLPGLFHQFGGLRREVRLVSLGCSAGEEPYSLAILLLESFTDLVRQQRVGILAVDTDSRSLAAATQGLFPAAALREVSAERLSRFFVPAGRDYRVIDEVRRMVRFVPMDLQQLDNTLQAELIMCRNTLIYFNRPAQEKNLRVMADILPQGGILVLGKSETMPSGLRGRFATLDLTERIYVRR